MTDNTVNISPEILSNLNKFEVSLINLENLFNQSYCTNNENLNIEASSLDKAKLDLVGTYTMNSLLWVYLKLNGEDTTNHPIAQELERIKTYMARIKEIQDKQHRPILDKEPVNRFIKNALWKRANAKNKD